MSGAKVVNLRALRLQQQRQASQAMADLREAISAWRAALDRSGEATRDTNRLASDRLKAVMAIEDRQDWVALFREAARSSEFFRSQTEAVRAAYEQKLKTARDRRRTVELLARSLGSSTTPSDGVDLAHIAATAATASDTQLAAFEADLQAVMSRLADATPNAKAATPLSRHVQDALRSTSGTALTLSQWQDRLAPADRDGARLDDALAKLQSLVSPPVLAPIAASAAAARAETGEVRRRQRIDSVLLAIDDALRQQGRLTAARNALTKATARSEPFHEMLPEALRLATSRAASSDDAPLIEKAVDQLERFSDQQEQLEEAYARREAVLTALSELGYTVHEDMLAAWVEQGRIVVAHRDRLASGLELSAAALPDGTQPPPAEDANIAMRPVAIGPAGATVSPAEGRQIEQSWCDAFAQWQAAIDGSGLQHSVKLDIPIGQQPVPTVASTNRQGQPRSPRTIVRPLRRIQRT